jgi:hypothetical protein
MKRKQVYFLLGAALILAIGATVFQMVRSASWKGESRDLEPFAQLPVNSIEKVVIRSDKGTVTLQKVNGIWTVAERGGYPADFSKIRDVVRSIWELKVVRALEVGPSQFGRLHILPPGKGDESGVELDMFDASGKPVKTLILGKASGGGDDSDAEAGSGRFVYDPSLKDRVYLTGETFYSVQAAPQEWLDKDFIKPGAIKEVMRGPAGNAPGWKLIRKDQTGSWQLADAKPGEALDQSAVNSLSSFSPSFEDVKAANTPDSETGLKSPLTVDLVTFDGFKYNLEIGGVGPQKSHFVRLKVSADLPSSRSAEPNESADDKKKKDEEFAKTQDQLKTRLAAEQKLQGWVFQVPDWSLETVLKARPDIVKLPPPSPSPKPSPNGSPAAGSNPQPNAATTPEAPPAAVVPLATPKSAVESKPQPTATPDVSAGAESTPGVSASPSPSARP